MKTKILFVCMGNICRSPAAEEVFRQFVKKRGVESRFVIDSAGTYGYHEGELPDPRMREHASRRGYQLTSHSRPVESTDFWGFDYILYMDDSNRIDLERKAPDVESTRKLHRMTKFATQYEIDHVPDPYYGGSKGFDLVLDILEDSCEGLLDYLLGEGVS